MAAARWQRARDFRNPHTLRDMIQLFAAGNADARRKDQPPPPAGFGVVATEGGGVGESFSGCSRR